MMLTDFDEKKFKEQTFEEGMDLACRKIVSNMLTQTDLSLSSIVNVSGLSEDAVREIAASLNIAVR